MLKRYFNNRSDFTKNILALVSSTVLAQVINLGFSVVLTRIYSPAAFGAISLFGAIVAFLSVISSGKYDIALVAAKEREEAKGLTALGVYITFIITVLTLIAAWVIYVVPIKFYNESPVRNWFYLVPLSLLFLSGFQVLWMWNVREKRFSTISPIRPIEALVNNTASFFLHAFDAIGLLLGMIAGQFLSFVLIVFFSIKKDGKDVVFQQRTRLKQLALKYVEFPKINIFQGFIDMFQLNALVLIISAYYDAKYLGYYALCLRVLQVPMRLIVAPVANVFFSEAATFHHERKPLYGLVKRTIMKVGLFILPFFVVIVIGGPYIFSFVFGEKWVEAGIYARIFALWLFLDMIRSPISQVAFVLGKQKQLLYYSLLASVFLIAAAFFGIHYLSSIHLALAAVSLSQVIALIIIIAFIINISKNKDM